MKSRNYSIKPQLQSTCNNTTIKEETTMTTEMQYQITDTGITLPATIKGVMAYIYNITKLDDYGEFILGDTFQSRWRYTPDDKIVEVTPPFYRQFIVEAIETTTTIHFTDELEHIEKTIIFHAHNLNGEHMATQSFTLQSITRSLNQD